MAIAAIYQDGVFKPLQPINLPEAAPVELEVIHEGRVVPNAAAPAAPQTSLWELMAGKNQFGPVPPDFKEPDEEWREYTE